MREFVRLPSIMRRSAPNPLPNAEFMRILRHAGNPNFAPHEVDDAVDIVATN